MSKRFKQSRKFPMPAASKHNQVQLKLQTALSLHQSGRIDEAEDIYRKILSVSPHHPSATHYLGIAKHQQGNLGEAIELLQKAATLDKGNPDLHNNFGVVLREAGELEQALVHYQTAVELRPNYADAHYNLGIVLHALKKHDDAIKSYEAALEIRPSHPEGHNNLGNVFKDIERYDEAVKSYLKALAIMPNFAHAVNNLGAVHWLQKDYSQAVRYYDRAIAIDPNYAEAFNNRGVVHRELEQFDNALNDYQTAIRLKPNYIEAMFNRGVVLQDLERPKEALRAYEEVLTLNPEHVNSLSNRGVVYQQLGDYDSALMSYERAIALRPDHADSYNNRANTLRKLGEKQKALEDYEQAIRCRPAYAEAYNNRGNLLLELGKLDEALSSFDTAIKLRPDYAEALNGRGNVLRTQGRQDEALQSYEQSVKYRPENANVNNNIGVVLHELGRLEEAYESYKKALSIDPDHLDVSVNVGNLLREGQHLELAVMHYQKAGSINADYPYLFGTYFHTLMKLCDWSHFEERLKIFKEKIEQDKPITTPFPPIALFDDPALHWHISNLYAKDKFPPRVVPVVNNLRSRNTKIRIGYFSADFHNHATAFLMAELFEKHDKSRFELYGFSFGRTNEGSMADRLKHSFDHYFYVKEKSDIEIADLSRELQIDIAIDLKGYTQEARTGIFARRCAPIQVNYLGYPGTMGCDYIDYVIADSIVIPPDSQHFYTEQVVYLPHSYQVNDSKRKISDRVFTRAELGLPDTGFVFCCFNNNYKILPAVFDSWMRILKSVNGSVLWLFQDNPTAAMNLKKEAQARGVDAERLVFAQRMKLDEHLARHRLADLFLDTLPYNAHTTASDSLWAGLPLLTRTGQSFASRVAASLLTAVGLPELITSSEEEYVSKAIELANDPAELQRLRDKLEANRLTMPLFNTELFARNLERAYEAMIENHRNGVNPAPICLN